MFKHNYFWRRSDLLIQQVVSGKYAVNFAVKISCLRAYEDLEVSAIIFCEILIMSPCTELDGINIIILFFKGSLNFLITQFKGIHNNQLFILQPQNVILRTLSLFFV